MTSIKNLSLFLALALGAATGCATDPADDGSGDGPLGGGDDGGGDAELPVDAAGTYQLQSKLDLAASAPGTVGDVINTIIDITDDPEDPTLWVLDQAIDAMPSGVLKTALKNAKPYVAGFLNDRILDLAPDFVGVAVQLGDNLGQMAKGFGLNESLVVSGAPGAYTGRLVIVGAHFKIDGIESDHAFADHDLADIPLDGVGVTLDAGKLGIGDHQFPLSYGQVLRLGLDGAIIPLLEPSARSLNELFASKINCPLIGQLIASAIGLGGASTYASACTSGLNRAASYIYGKIAAIDGTAMQLELAGAARAIDRDRDGAIDTINTGAWTGAVTYGSAAAPLEGATFFGSRQ